MSAELKKLIEDVNASFDLFKKTNDERLKQIETKGAADPLLAQKLESVEQELDKAQDRLKAVETAYARKSNSAQASEFSAKEQKHLRDFIITAEKMRGTKIEGDVGAVLSDYKQAFNGFLRKGDMFVNSPANLKALSVGSDPDGGYLVDPDTSGQIVKQVFETSPMRSVASIQQIGTDALEGVNDLNRSSSGWVGEMGTRAETATPEIGMWRIPVHEIYAEPKATQKMLDDAYIDIEMWLAEKIAEDFSLKENEAFVTGNGVAKPRGFLTYSDGTTLPGTIERINSGANGAFKTDGTGGDCLIDLTASLKQAYRANARFFMSRTTVAAVRKIKDADGRYMWMPGLGPTQPATLLGYSIVEFEDMPDITTGSLSIAFADMRKAYQIVDRAGIRVLRDPYTAKPFVKFYSTKRVGGDVINFEAIKLLEFSAS